MQTITRKDLNSLYNANICDKWKTQIITLLVEQQVNTDIEVKDDLIQAAYKEGDAAQKKLLTKFFELPQSKIEKIKTFADVCKVLGKTEAEIVPFFKVENNNQKRMNAFAKIMAIAEVFNEGWEPDWSNKSEYKYYPYFEYKARAGWGFYDSYSCYGSSSYGRVAYYKSSEIASYVGKTFIEIYKEYI